MLEVKEFRIEDADYLFPIAVDNFPSGNFGLCKKAVGCSSSYTAFHNDKPVCAGGVKLFEDKEGNNVGLVWAVFSPWVREHKTAVFRTLKTMLKILIEKFELKSLLTDSCKGFDASQRLLEHLGFKKTDKETDTLYFYRLEV